MTPTIYLVSLILPFILLYQYILLPLFLSPLSKIPAANPLSPITNLWILYIRWRNIENQTLLRLHQKLGPIVRLAPNELSVNCYEGGLKTIYGGGFAKDEFYVRRFVNYGKVNMLCMTDNKAHGLRRRMLSSVYSKSSIMSSASLRVTSRNMLFDRLLPQLVKSAEAGKPVDVFKLSYAYSMDSFMAFQFGLKLGSNFLLDTKERDWYMDAFFGRRQWYFWSDNFSGLVGGLLRVGIHLVPKWITIANHEAADWILKKCDLAEEMVSSGEELPVGDVPTPYVQERAAFRKASGDGGDGAPEDYPYRWELASEMYDHKAAAMETSGDTLTYIFYEMSRHPELQKKLRDELLKLDPPLKCSLEGDAELPEFKAVDDIPLLGAILQETLRRWAPVPGGQPRVTPPPVCSLAGYDNIPPGVKVHSSAGVLHRNPEVFPNPEEWTPDRWLDSSDKQTSEMNRWFWAWSSGGTTCLGNNFATNSMKLVIATVYSNFTTKIVDAKGIEQDEGYTAGPRGSKLMLQFDRVK
ncbi:hypothetical protein M409DRAFT_69345 [Zasmidium cellare ATCC 36951]|uniref:Cytochrome P450 n=1 Tax=Zasmidium cellare ATCC 36951 TaxID=1080233 RepID=A0A6A6C4S4_ZASCE|nr:uncharacterized protein M409DRAFT_69345 [Zasmidium cellare ATCC 36951]KAF2162134.1 hypothetical protein M409DRAFT_69345 [Zasmidium cellare ATCC 36951]